MPLITITHDLSVAALAGRRFRLDVGRLTPVASGDALAAATSDRSEA